MKKVISFLLSVFLLSAAGCVDHGIEPARVSMLSFSLDAQSEANDGLLESSVDFTIDNVRGTIKGSYTPSTTTPLPSYLSATFDHDGVRALLGGEDPRTVESGAMMSFNRDFTLILENAHGGKKTYTVSLEWNDPALDSKSTMLSFSIPKSHNPVLSDDIELALSGNAYKGKYLRWINKPSPDVMVPVFELDSPFAKMFVGEQEVISGVTEVSFADDVEFKVVSRDGANTNTYKVSIICPQINTELPVLHIFDLRPDDVFLKDIKYRMSAVEMHSNTSDEGRWERTDAKVGIRHYEDHSGKDWPKKPYDIKFPVGFTPPGMPHSARSWTLLSNDNDKSQLRNLIAFELSKVLFNPAEGYHNPLAIMFTPASQHVNLYMKGEYIGIYQMTDQVDDRTADRMYVDELLYTQTSESELEGGYLLEFSPKPGIWPSFSTTLRGYSAYMKYPYPSDSDATGFASQPDNNSVSAHLDYIAGIVNSANAAIYSHSKDAPEGQGGWRDWIDEKTYIDYFIIKEFMGDLDGFTFNRMYKRRGSQKLFFGPIWNCDKAIANDKWVNSYLTSLLLLDNNFVVYAGYQMNGIGNVTLPDWITEMYKGSFNYVRTTEIREVVLARWDARKGALKEAAFRVLDEMPARMSKSLEAMYDFDGISEYSQVRTAPWPWNSQFDNAPLPAESYSAEIAHMRSWLEDRFELLDEYFTRVIGPIALVMS